MRVHKLNNVEQAMDLLEKHKVYLVLFFLCHVSCYVISQEGRCQWEEGGAVWRKGGIEPWISNGLV